MKTYKLQMIGINGKITSRVFESYTLEMAVIEAKAFSEAFNKDVNLFEEKETGYEQVYCYSSFSDEEHYI